jgi:hypothetical protein
MGLAGFEELFILYAVMGVVLDIIVEGEVLYELGKKLLIEDDEVMDVVEELGYLFEFLLGEGFGSGLGES